MKDTTPTKAELKAQLFGDSNVKTIILAKDDYAALMRAIEAPTEPSQALKDLMRRLPPWKEP